MEKIMEYFLEKMDWEDNDKIDVIYLIDKVKAILLNDEQAKLYIKNLIDSKLDSKLSNKYIDVALHNIKTSELSTLLRISEMEAILEEALERMDNAEAQPEALLEYQSEIKRLEEYYTSQDWKDDFELDEEGLLPSDLKRGVLSEDEIYDALEWNKELLEELW